ncbi:aminotransferase class V-fold PLP-dependent enzyme [Roseateles oligotrophus]|uniref:cysteine desulfurase n=1 Tax=Roseateles oligotrophus TaxID=1769250 RepID=A0ABT2YL04_9BURK|nr:aminotransferase class V-fold PLP-dependent enzyme [Roseateles oligotrophus]MCV2370585.1 aminotransferase class V-fold PLP-dependent enzyme [Roseateles oligotrophus]
MEIYLDANATTPVLPQAKAAAIQAMVEDYGNPSSVHSTGLKAKALIDGVRARAQRLLDTGDGALLFVSGATEGIQTAVLSALNALRGNLQAEFLLYGATEHKAVPEALKHWNQVLGLNLKIEAIPVDSQGRHDLAFLRQHAARAGLVCTMAANNETGVISDLDGIEAALAGSKALWLVDGVQALGKLPLRLQARRIDYAPFSGHKLYAPKGIGLLYVRAGAPFTPLMAGGGQEGSLRSGTENMSGIAALGAVLAALDDGQTLRDSATLHGFRARLAAALSEAFPGLVFNAPLDLSLPTTLNFAVPGLSSRLLQDLFDAADVRVSAGSACSAAKAAPSFVLQAMGLPDWQAAGAVRLSIGPAVDEAFIDEACARIRACGESLRRHCLSPENNFPTVGDGITRYMQDGACCYLLADSLGKACVLIDARPEQVCRLAQALTCQGYPLLAVLSTTGEAEHAEARDLLAETIGELMPGAACDALGWPLDKAALELGAKQLTRAVRPQGQVLLFSGADSAAPALAFTGLSEPADLGACVGPNTLLAPARDEAQQVAYCLAGAEPAQEQESAAQQVQGAQLKAFINYHPDALLVDVREPYEQFLSQTPDLVGAQMEAMPLSRLLNAIQPWLAEQPQRPLLFFCRTGNRSRQAAQALTRLGHSQAWTLAGGLALLPHSPAEAQAKHQPDPALYV